MSDWTGLEELVAIAENGTFAAAARKLRRSTSHVSRAIAQLEHRIGSTLLHRTTRQVSLTAAGRELAERGRRIIDERDAALAVASGDPGLRGSLRITCPTALGEYFIAPLALRHAMANPSLDVTLDFSNRVVDIVAEGFDVAIRTGPQSDLRLAAHRLGGRNLVTCAAPAYLAQRGRPEEIEELDSHDCLVGSAELWHFRRNRAETTYQPQGRWRCNNGPAVTAAAVAGLGICQVPDFYAARALAQGQLEPVLEAFRATEEAVWAMHPRRRLVPRKVADFIALLAAELPGAMAGGLGAISANPADLPGACP
ncbi:MULTISPECIES: LysR family transcriptional regulator [unclassified Novosphingobium]|uniref:LysR family transcriptional regulator n=1 Tax=unclassified Novosphingobium TaxID=2644732 RepID=UPI00146F27BC|nr:MULTISPECIES: LysR family transcriptional regulator [unclassified Novosphingobium]NMN04313.1 DNA-binding transcriptional LysR family regulator [Novosphingobium sp. SG919]NMN85696.1 DNA-binding transcriptional LysR family regulator [Novosphingobium sp. SG916]